MRLRKRKESGTNGRNPRTIRFGDEASGADSVCPRLGMLGDPLTSYGYPHPGNACSAVEPACPVRLEHQSAACLSGKYKTCSLYHFHNRLGSGRRTLPVEVLNQALVLKRSRSVRERPFLAILVALLVIGTIYTFFNVWMPSMALDLGGFEKGMLVDDPTPFVTTRLQLSPQTELPLDPVAVPATTLVLQVPPSPTAPPSITPLDIVELLATQPSSTPESATTSTTRTPRPTGTPAQCVPRTGWLVYTVRPGDTLYRLSQVLGISVNDIRQANCLESGNIIDVGQSLYLPGLPALPPAKPTRTPPPPPATLQPTNPPPPAATATPLPPTHTPVPIPPTHTSPPPTPTPRSTPTSAPTEPGS